MRPVGSAPAARVLTPSALALAVACAFGGAPHLSRAQPSGAAAVHGTVTLSQPSAQQLLVTTTNGAGTGHSVVNWQSFSIPGGTQTHIAQPGATSLSINRVVAANPSLIYGTLSSNGQVLLVNPSGITVGAGAVVDTAGFLASTLPMSEADAIAGRLHFAGAGGDLVVNGQIVAREGDVVLVAPQVTVGAGGVVQSPNGSVILAAGQQAEITGRGLEGIALQVQAPTDRALNLGTLKGDAVGIFAGTLQHSGLIQANAVTTEGGRVVLKAQEAATLNGTVQAVRGDQGGVVHATARQVSVGSAAVLDVSGAQGGGELLVGGGWQGKDSRLANATSTTVAAGAQLRADALVNGNGGTVVVWADGSTQYQGHISARGGAAGGNGGQAEVSGKQWLGFGGTVDLLAPQGQKGTLLLDPLNIEIGVVADLDGSGGGGDDVIGDIASGDNAGATSKITAAALNTLLGSTAVTLAATNNIDVKANINGSEDLTLQAGNKITLDAGIGGMNTLTLTAGAGGIVQNSGALTPSTYLVLNASGDVSLTSSTNNIQYLTTNITNGGSLTLRNDAASSLTLYNGVNVAGNFTVNAPNLNVDQSGGSVVVGGTTTLNVGTGSITLDDNGNNFNVFGSTSDSLDLVDSNALKLNAITTSAGVDITAGGALTRSAGTLTSGDDITLDATSIGSAADSLVIDVDGTVGLTLTGAGGGLYVRQASGTLNLNDYTINTGTGSATVKFSADSININSSIGGTVSDDVLSFTALTGNIVAVSGLDLTGASIELVTQGASGAIQIGNSATADVQLTTTSGVTFKTAGGAVTQMDELLLTGGALTLAAGGNVTLTDSANVLGTVSGSISGTTSLTGFTAVGANGLTSGGTATLVSGGALAINGALASTSGDISATATGALSVGSSGSVSGSNITLAGSSINIDGKVYPGRDGVAGGQLTLNGATTFGSTSQVYLDFNGSTFDKITSANAASFASGARLVVKLTGAAPVGNFTVYNGDTQGTLPTLAGNVPGGTLSLGSLVLSIPAPPLTQTVTTTPLFDQEVGGAGADTLPEAVVVPDQLALADDDIVVDDVSCRPR